MQERPTAKAIPINTPIRNYLGVFMGAMLHNYLFGSIITLSELEPSDASLKPNPASSNASL